MTARDGARLAAFEARVGTLRQVLALAWLPVLVGSRIASHSGVELALDLASSAIWLFFVAEYLWRLWLAPARRAYFRSHLFDLAALIFPPLRALWGLAPFRDVLSRPGVGVFLVSMLAVVLGSAGLVFVIERNAEGANIDSFGDALWWALVTVTTVGYGDNTPVSGLGRSVAGGLILVGVVLYSVVTAHITAYVIERSRGTEPATVQELVERLSTMEAALRSIDRRLDARIPPDGRAHDAGSAGREAS
jgi:voltage-gated potassium channel